MNCDIVVSLGPVGAHPGTHEKVAVYDYKGRWLGLDNVGTGALGDLMIAAMDLATEAAKELALRHAPVTR